MTTQEIKNYYANLLILQYLGKPKAYATIQALVSPVVMDQLPIAVQNAFNLDGSAVGVQLDVIGKYVGVTRSGTGTSGPITLNDADFITLIKLAIIKNNAGSSLAAIQALLAQYFLGQIFVFDLKSMQLSYYINASFISSNVAQLFLKETLLPKPMGVQLSSTIYAANLANFFGFRTYSLAAYNTTPFNNYASYEMAWPWLSYANRL